MIRKLSVPLDEDERRVEESEEEEAQSLHDSDSEAEDELSGQGTFPRKKTLLKI